MKELQRTKNLQELPKKKKKEFHKNFKRSQKINSGICCTNCCLISLVFSRVCEGVKKVAKSALDD